MLQAVSLPLVPILAEGVCLRELSLVRSAQLVFREALRTPDLRRVGVECEL